MLKQIIFGKCVSIKISLEVGWKGSLQQKPSTSTPLIAVSACLLGLASAQFEDICAGANGNTPCCYSNNGAGPDSTYLFMTAADVESNLLLCLANGGHLAYIETVAENDCLNQYIQEGK